MEIGKVCLRKSVDRNFEEDPVDVLLSVIMFLDVFWISLIPFFHPQILIKVFLVEFGFSGYHGL